MNYEKALSLYKSDKTLQLLRAEHFPLLVSFFHLAFKEKDRIAYMQSELTSLLSDFLFALRQKEVTDYQKAPEEYLIRWAEQGYLRRYYESADEPMFELSASAEGALKWLEDLNKQEFVGTHSRLLQFFQLLKQIVSGTSGPQARLEELAAQKAAIDAEMEQIEAGNFVKTSSTQIKENYYLAVETAQRLLADFRQVEENFRALDMQTRQTIVKSSLAKGKLLDEVFEQQDHLWDTDQGKSFQSFWEFLMSQQMQEEFEQLLDKINDLPEIEAIKRDKVVDRIKINLVDAGDKVNRSNDGLIEQLRKFVEQKNLAESRSILRNIEQIEEILLDHHTLLSEQPVLMTINGVIKPNLVMGRPLFSPPAKVAFTGSSVALGQANADTQLLFNQFYIDLEVLRANIRQALISKPQVSLGQLLEQFPPRKGIAEILGYLQIATRYKKHLVLRDREELIDFQGGYQEVTNIEAELEQGGLEAPVALDQTGDDTEKQPRRLYRLKMPVVVFNR